jgi:hypothetical protein
LTDFSGYVCECILELFKELEMGNANETSQTSPLELIEGGLPADCEFFHERVRFTHLAGMNNLVASFKVQHL